MLSRDPVEFVVVARNGFTKKLYERACVEPGTRLRVAVEGPYGAVPSAKAFDRVVIFAGGSGATFAFALATEWSRSAAGADKRLEIVWSMRDVACLQWFEKELAMLSTDSRVTVTVHVTQSRQAKASSADTLPTDSVDRDIEKTAMSPSLPSSRIAIETGRPDVNAVVKAVVETSESTDRVLVAADGQGLIHQHLPSLALPLFKLAVRHHRSHSLPSLSRPPSPTRPTGQAEELPFLRELHKSQRRLPFTVNLPSPTTALLGLLLVLVLLAQFLLPHLPLSYQNLFLRSYPKPAPLSCPPAPTYNPFIQDLYCRVPVYKPSSIYNKSPRSMALAAAAQRVALEFEYSAQDVNRGVYEFIREMDEGLSKQGATMSQIPTYVTAVPNGTEKGLYMAVDLGGTNFRVCSIQLHGNSTFSLTQSKVAIPKELMVAKTSRELFAFLAKQIQKFLQQHHGEHYNAHVERRASVFGPPHDEQIFSLGFTFSFPVQQSGINKGTLIRWTKGFDIHDTIGKDVCALLQTEIDRLGLPVRVAALVNDTVGTLMARSYTSPGKTGTLLGAIFGTGTNGAYVEKLDKVTKLGKGADVDNSTGEMIINSEWGSFDNHLSVLPDTPYDHSLDAESNNPGIQMFEKRISGMFLGEILRRALMSLVDDKSVPLFSDEHSNQNDVHSTTNIDSDSPLRKQWGLDTSFLSITSGDSSAGLKVTRQTLDNDYGISAASAEDAEAVRLIAAAIGKRAARLSAVAIAAVVISTGKLGDPQDIATTSNTEVNEDDVVDVGVDGSLVEFYPNFEEYIREALREIPEIGAQGEKRIRIGIAKDGSGVGAALIALVADKAMKGDVTRPAGGVEGFLGSLWSALNRNLRVMV
ncbi:glucokinase [Oleoguttula sp. CCFEE 5521]